MQMLPPYVEKSGSCSVADCDKTKHLRRGLCTKHYRAMTLYGDPLLTWADVKPVKTCSIDECSNKPWARGWCSMHWQRWKRHGDPLREPAGKVWDDTCRHPECDRARKSGGGRGYCAMHYGRLLRNGDVGDGAPTVMSHSWRGVVCSVDECHEPVSALGYCNIHHLRFKRTGDPMKVLRVASLNGVTCSLDECAEPAFAKALCKIHYDRKQRNGDPRKVIAVNWDGVPCLVKGCVDRVKSKGYCNTHYRRWRKFGDAAHPGRSFVPAKGHVCNVDGCQSERKANGMCAYHSQVDYKRKNPMLAKLASQRRRARKIGAYVADYSHNDLAQRMAYFGNKCWMCGGPFEHVDHVKPLAKRGKDCLSNMRPACRPCNQSKNARWYGVSGLHTFIKT